MNAKPCCLLLLPPFRASAGPGWELIEWDFLPLDEALSSAPAVAASVTEWLEYSYGGTFSD